MPEGVYRPEFAIGELWSRACNMFAAGMRARRMEESVSACAVRVWWFAPDREAPEISEQEFEQD